MPQPDAPVPGPAPVPAPVAAPAAPVAPAPASVPAQPKGAAPSHDSVESDETEETRPRDVSPWTIGLGVLSAALIIVSFILWGRIGAREDEIAANQNRSEQVEAGAVVRQAQLIEARAVTDRVQKQLDEKLAEIAQLNVTLAKTKSASDVVQTQLEKARLLSTGFQTQMEEAKVSSLKRQGEVEVAQAQTAVARTESTKALADLAQVQLQWEESKKLVADLQTRLGKAELEIIQLKKPPVRK